MTPTRLLLRIGLLAPIALLLAPNLLFPYFEDTAGFAAIARFCGQGLALYRDLLDQKPPAIFIQEQLRLALFGDSNLSLRLVELAWLMGGAFLVGRMACEARGARAGAIAAVAFAGLSSITFWDLAERGQVEFYQTVTLAAAAVAARRAVVTAGAAALLWGAAAGAAAAWACWYKPQAAVLGVVVAVALVVDPRPGRERLRALVGLAAGGLLISAGVLLRLVVRGELAGFREIMFEFNTSYVAATEGGVWFRLEPLFTTFLATPQGFVGLILAGVGAVWTAWAAWTGALPRSLALLLLAPLPWAVLVFYTGGYRFRYHAIPCILAGAWFVALAIDVLAARALRALRPGLQRLILGVVCLLLAVSGRWLVGAADLGRWAVGAVSTDEVHRAYGRAMHYFRYENQRSAAALVSRRLGPDEAFFVFGRAGVTYLFGGRLPISRHLVTTTAYMNVPLAAKIHRELMQALRARPPKLLLVRDDDQFPWFGVPLSSARLLDRDPELAAFVRQRYRITETIPSFVVLERCPGDACAP